MNELLSVVSRVLGEREACECGRTHTTSLRTVCVEAGALERVGPYLKKRAVAPAYLVADEQTFAAAGLRLERYLNACGVKAETVIFRVPLVPDEAALTHLQEATSGQAGALVAVGAGTLHDLTRYVASEQKVPFISVPTAPSVDGFASAVSALIVNGVKKTFAAKMPEGIFADTVVLREAPRELIAAGYGDILGKKTSLADWLLSHIITGEWHCPRIAALVSTIVDRVVESRYSLLNGDEGAVETLITGLIVSGISIELAGSSRPASGAEHHLSHYWEMRGLWTGSPPHYHGAKVGVATPIMARIYGELLSHDEPASILGPPVTWAEIRERINRYFGPLAGLVAEENATRYANPQIGEKRRLRIIERWDELREKLRPLMADSTSIRALLTDAGAPSSPAALGIPQDWVRAGVLAAKEVRDRYTILQLADDLGVLTSVGQKGF